MRNTIVNQDLLSAVRWTVIDNNIIKRSFMFIIEGISFKKGFPLKEALEMAEIDEETYNNHKTAWLIMVRHSAYYQ